MTYRLIHLAALSALVSLSACSEETPVNPGLHPGEPTALTLTPMAQLNAATADINSGAADCSSASLMMDGRSLCVLGPDELGMDRVHYPRLRTNARGEFLLFFQQDPQAQDTYQMRSADMKSWSAVEPFALSYPITNNLGQADHRGYTTVEAILLPDGDMLAACSYRALKGYASCPTDDGLVVRRSTDGGKTWGPEIPVYQGPNWEPTFLRRASGRIEIYFSQSRPQISGSHSGTDVVWSDDNGHTWQPAFGEQPYTVVRHSWLNENGEKRWTDQMPYTIELNGSRRLVTVNEAKCNQSESKFFHICLAYSGDDGVYPRLTDEMEGPAERVMNRWRGTNPCIVQFPSGETVTSYNQYTQGKSSQTFMHMGDADARNWGDSITMFDRTTGAWAAMHVESPHSLLATAPSTDFTQIICGRYFLNHAIAATRRAGRVDGDNSEWTREDEALFVSGSEAQATLRCSADEENVYFLVEVLDNDISRDDHINILLCPPTSTGRITSEARRIKVAPYGLLSTDQYAGGWRPLDIGATVDTRYDGSISDAADSDHGWLAEVAVPRRNLVIKDGCVLTNLVVFDLKDGEKAIAPTTSDSLAKWIPIRGL